MRLGSTFGTDHDRRLWSVLLLFILAVLLPTAGVLWLIHDSISKQQQLSRQQLADAYRLQLKTVAERLDQTWQTESARLARLATGKPAASRWVAALQDSGLDSLVLFDEDGRVLYPTPLFSPDPEVQQGSDWARARQMEERASLEDIRTAAGLYNEIASRSKEPRMVALARQAQIRSLRLSGDTSGATALTFQSFLDERLDGALDGQGRVIAGDALLLAIQSSQPSDARRTRAAERLHALLTDYQHSSLPSPQRLFLMKEMLATKSLPARLQTFPTLQAEELALKVTEIGIARTFDGMLRPSSIRDLWMMGSADGRAIGLLRSATVKDRIKSFLAAQSMPAQVRINMLDRGADAKGAIETLPAGAYAPEWRLALFLADAEPAAEIESHQQALYLWAGALLVMAVVAIAYIAGRSMHRQMRLANLKSDLVATVSHELKTPLASTRLLLDTLLEREELDLQQTREYLQLMDRENNRLTHTIENFLAFSRLERNRYSFRFAEARPVEIVDKAIEAFADRAAEPNVRLKVDVAPDLPPLHADPDALSTVVINLLDNAYKYTSEDKRIGVRAFRENGSVCFEVEDNGIGLASSEVSRVFRDFYQVDNRLARSRGGCGLGLTIVKFIVEAHKGAVSVNSRIGEGSTFRVELPWTERA